MSSNTISEQESTNSDAPEDATLAAEVEALREENHRLREEYAAARRTQYRRTAFTLASVGLLSGMAGVLFVSAREVLFALAGTGVFLGVLIYYLTPEQFIAAEVGQRIYESFARNGTAITAELGLQDQRVYVPSDGTISDVRMFVPQHSEFDIPDDETLEETFIVTSEKATRGIALYPTGAALAADFERALSGELSDDPGEVAAALTDALVEQFELVDSTVDIDAEAGRVTIGVTDSTYDSIDRFDHPVESFLAAGLAGTLNAPVTPEVSTGDERADYLVTCRWPTGSHETDYSRS